MKKIVITRDPSGYDPEGPRINDPTLEKMKRHCWRWLSAHPARPSQRCRDCRLTRVGTVYSRDGRLIDKVVHPETRTPVTPPCEAKP